MLELRLVLITWVPCAADAAIQTKRLMSTKLFLEPGPVLFCEPGSFCHLFLESKNSKIINTKRLMSRALSRAKTRTFLQTRVFLSHFLATQKPANYTMLSARNARNHFLASSVGEPQEKLLVSFWLIVNSASGGIWCMTRPMAPLEQNQLTNNRFFDTETNINIMQPSKIYLQINRDQGVSEITLLA